MDNPRAIYSRGIWQGGGATVLKQPDYSHIFDKAIKAQAAKDKAAADKKAKDKEEFDKLLQIKGDFDYAKSDIMLQKKLDFEENSRKLAESVGWDLSGTPEGQRIRSQIDANRKNLELEFVGTKQNAAVFHNLTDKILPNLGKGLYYPEQEKEINAQLKDIADDEDTRSTSQKLNTFAGSADLEFRPDVNGSYEKNAAKLLKENGVASPRFDPTLGTIQMFADRKIDQKDIDQLNNTMRQDTKFMHDLERDYKYEGSKEVDINGNQKYTSLDQYVNSRLKTLGENYIYTKVNGSQFMPGGAGFNEQQVKTTPVQAQRKDVNIGVDAVGGGVGYITMNVPVTSIRSHQRKSGYQIKPPSQAVSTDGEFNKLLKKGTQVYVDGDYFAYVRVATEDVTYNGKFYKKGQVIPVKDSQIIPDEIKGKYNYISWVSGSASEKGTLNPDGSISIANGKPFAAPTEDLTEAEVNQMFGIPFKDAVDGKEKDAWTFTHDEQKRMNSEDPYSYESYKKKTTTPKTTQTKTKITFAEWQKKNPKGTYAEYKKQNP